jgi:multidrug transporter EmrE-like cation transporter
MNLATFLIFFTSICLNAVAQLLLKKGANAVGAINLTADNWFSTGVNIATQLPIIGGLTCYVVSVIFWIIVLSRADVAVAYPMTALGYVLTSLGAWYFLSEGFSLQRIAAIVIIIVGVVLLMRS